MLGILEARVVVSVLLKSGQLVPSGLFFVVDVTLGLGLIVLLADVVPASAAAMLDSKTSADGFLFSGLFETWRGWYIVRQLMWHRSMLSRTRHCLALMLLWMPWEIHGMCTRYQACRSADIRILRNPMAATSLILLHTASVQLP